MKSRPLRAIAASLALVVFAFGYEQVAPPKDVVLPPPRSPADSLAAIKVPPSFRVELVAAEPLVMDPIDIAWGPDGRIWVVEMADYPNGMDGKGKPGGRVRILESTRGDGRYDKSTLFADGLNFPNSVLPWRKGALVVAAPDVLYLEDTDRDGRADLVEKRFSGFNEGNQQHRANGLQWGLDGWLYLANGDSGGKVVSPKTGQILELGRRDLRIKPDHGLVEIVSGQTQYGRNRDDWGNWFGNNNSNPIWHYALDDRYLARNPHVPVPRGTVNVPAIPGPAPVYPASRTMARFNDASRLNHFTSACGTMVYRDDLLGAEIAGNIFVCEPVHNLVHREIVSPKGVTFSGRRAPAEQTSEFFASGDNWSRFTSARTGPDGALYIVDMYRLTIEHPTWIPDAWQKIIRDVRAGSDKGRIYRVVRENVSPRAIPRLDRASSIEVVQALESPNGTVRDLAHQLLVWRDDRSVIPALEQLAADSAKPETRVQALCSLDTLEALRPEIVANALRDSHPGVLRQAIRLAEQFAATLNPELLSRAIALVEHPDAAVRQQVAYSLGEWRSPDAGAALARLIQASDDPFIRAAALSSALPHSAVLLAGPGSNGEDSGLVEIAIATRNVPALARMLAAIAAPRNPPLPVTQLAALTHLVESLQRNQQSIDSLRTIADANMRQALAAANEVLSDARLIIADTSVPLPHRVAAVRLLGRQEEDGKPLAGLVVPQSPVDLQLAAIAALGRLSSPEVPEWLLKDWTTHSPKVRTAVLDLLASRSEWAHALLARVETDRTLLSQIDLGRRGALTRHSNIKVAERATKIFSSGIDANRQQVIDRYLREMAPLQPDLTKGAAVFSNVCNACHQFGSSVGGAIGPDLAGIKDRSPAYLVTHILDPNRALEDRYMLSSAGTTDGRTFAGAIAAETGNSITMRNLEGVEQTILRTDLKWLTTSGRSLMPDGLEASINPQQMSDLVAFIASGGPGSPKR
jgi:putative membrane-bound dehydrogenase-like protein